MRSHDALEGSPQDASQLGRIAASADGKAIGGNQVTPSQVSLSDDQAQVALVHVAAPLSADQSERLTRALGRHFGGAIRLNVELDPSVIGGVWVRVGDTVIDGSVRGRLDELRQHLCARCRIMLSGGRV